MSTSNSSKAKVQTANVEIQRLKKEVWKYYHAQGRHDLPWRQPTLKLRHANQKIFDPYRIMVSEMMLQQTQVPRVIEKYKSFLKTFPTVRSLAKASLSDVLSVWNGLGYNRRGKYLYDAAKVIVRDHKGKVPQDIASLRKLPGMGPYSASAVRVFAFNLPDVLLETNVRAVYIHHFYGSDLPAHRSIGAGGQKTAIRDAQILPLMELAAAGQDPRKWHWALMDYGVQIKHLHKNPTRRSATYVMQNKFVGSLREIRGAVIKLLNTGAHGDLAIAQKLSFDERRTREALSALKKDGLVTSHKGSWRIA